MNRPNFEDIKSGDEFNQWYWLKKEMVDICKRSGLPVNGKKFDLRDRIMYALDHDGKVQPSKGAKQKTKSKFNWATSELTIATRITDNVSFGPNFRRFMKNEIGNKFSCHLDFMAWVKSNEGKTLGEAVQKWHELEKRKENPHFKREIPGNNMYNQYTRDFLEDNPDKSIKDARSHWLLKKARPMKNGFVKYEKSDLKLK